MNGVINSSVTTDFNGNFEFSNVTFPVTVKVSYMGFNDLEIKAEKLTDLPKTITLKEDVSLLEEVVVVAYGVRKKGTIAGSVSSVKGDIVENTPAASFDQSLQGQVPGLTVLSSSGSPSASATFAIRGTNSINSGTSPLFILDGAPISSSDFNTINPNDIDNISVLKDASSTSIYGARAANGVVIITSKRGKAAEGKPTITLRAQAGISQMAYGKWDMMNTSERIQYEKMIGLNEGMDYSQLEGIDISWIDEVFNNNAPMQSYDVSVSGAKQDVNYYVSGNYYDQEGTAYNSYFKRFGFRANFDVKAAKWMKIGVNSMLAYEKYAEADEGSYTLVTPISAARFMLPYYSPYKADGSLASLSDGSWKGVNQNPLEWAENNPLSRKKYKLMLTPFVEFTPVKGLTVRSQFSLDFLHTTAFVQSLPSYVPNNGSGTASRSATDTKTLSVTNTVNYSTSLSNGDGLTFMLGQEGVDYSYEGFAISTSGQNNDFLTNISSGTIAKSWSDLYSSYSYLSFFGRAEYHHSDKYYADLSLRTDASSRFGKDGRWARFWSGGFMWNVRNEKAINLPDWINKAQVAVSTGTSGNSSIPNYDHLALVSGGYDYMGDAGVAPTQKGNEKLGWEKLWTTNLAFHLGFIDRINADIELYNKKTTDMLMEVPVSYATNSGIGFEWQNVGAMVNRGAELALTGNVVRTKDFSWDLSANVSYNFNKITELYNGVSEYEYSNTNTKLVVGKSAGDFYMNRYAGVNPINGDPLWYTKDGEITNVMRDSDKVLVGKSYMAPWAGGFGTNLNWKGISLNAQFSWVADRWMVNNDRYFDESNGRFSSYNQSKRLLNCWQKPGDVTDIPRYGEYTQFDTRLLEDASFLRLKNLTLSYNLPESLVRKTKCISRTRIYVQGQNLLTFTKFTGLDPEGTSNIYAAQYPMSRQYTIGIDVTF